MVETPLAFNFSKTRTVCDAFDDAWAFLQGIGSDLTEPSKSLASRTMLAKRIIEMADQGLMDVTELRDGALAFVQHNRGLIEIRGIEEGGATFNVIAIFAKGSTRR
jgi:hypothetical protein